VQWIYAPDSDVNNNPDNPIINTRSFGEDPQKVAQFVSEFVRGVQENGGLATAKHFPGHGDTSADSHIDLPMIHADRQRIENLELVPFRAAIAAGADTIMTGHLSIPALEPDPNVPATLSPNILTGLLRDELHYQGLVVTDAMDMGGITVRYAPGDAAVRAFAAGVDALLMPPVPEAAFDALKAAVKSGRIKRDRLDASVRRILQAKARLGLYKSRLVDVNALNKNFGKVEWQREAQDISDRGITLLRDTPHRLPLDETKPTRVLLVALYADPEPYPGEDLERELRSRVDSVVTLRADTRFVKADNLKLPSADSYDVALLAFFVRVSDRKGNVDIPAEQSALADKVYKNGKPVVTLAFGSPYLVEHFPQAETWLAAFGISDVAQISAARALFGQIPVRGHLPVTIPGLDMKAGFGMEVAADPMTVQPMDHRGQSIPRSYARRRLQGQSFAARFRQAQLRRRVAASKSAHHVRRRFAHQSHRDHYARRKTRGRRFQVATASRCAHRALLAGVGLRPATRVAPQSHRAAFDDAYLRLAPVQGVLAELQGLGRHSTHDFR
jgi:beta-N-acetylhexosaminidase